MDALILLARSAPRERFDRDASFTTEWRLRCATQADVAEATRYYGRDSAMRLYGAERPAILESRHVETGPEAKPEQPWEPFAIEPTPEEAMQTTNLLQSGVEPLHPAVQDWQVFNEHKASVLTELHRAKVDYYGKDLLGRVKETEGQADWEWKTRCQDLYDAELKKAKLYSKAKNNTAPQAKIDAIQAKVKIACLRQKEEARARLEEAGQAAEAKFTTDKLRGFCKRS